VTSNPPGGSPSLLAFFFMPRKPGVLKEDFPQLLRTVSLVAVRAVAIRRQLRSAHIATLDSNHDWGSS
jgi:hypothetical protein